MQNVGSELNLNCLQINSFQPSTNIECPSQFTTSLWEKISICTKKNLVENNFVIPEGLKGNYRYYNVDNCRIIIDFDSIIGEGHIRFGQNLQTKEFLAFKSIRSSEHNPQVVGLRNLNRLRGLIFDNDKVWMAMELVNGVSLVTYNWKVHVNSLDRAIKLALSYLDELEFVEKCGVNQSDEHTGNIMVDLKKDKVFLIDFSGNCTFNFKTSKFMPNKLLPYISIFDLNAIMTLLPLPRELEKNTLSEKYENFHSFLLERRHSGERNETNPYYFKFTIGDLRKELSNLLN